MSYSIALGFADVACGPGDPTGASAEGVFFERRCVNLHDPATMAELKRLMVDRLGVRMVDSRLWTPDDERVFADWAERDDEVQRTPSGWAYPTQRALERLFDHCMLPVSSTRTEAVYRNLCDGAYPRLEPVVLWALESRPYRERVEVTAPPLGMPAVVTYIEPGGAPGPAPPGPGEPAAEGPADRVVLGRAAASPLWAFVGVGVLMATAYWALRRGRVTR